MSDVQVKRRDDRAGSKSQSGKKADILFYVMAISAVVLSLVFAPKVIGSTGLSFLAAGAGLNKLVSVLLAVGLGWLCLLPLQSFKDFMELAKGAKNEWRKTVKPDRDTVTKTTMMVLVIVALFALLILLLDGVFGGVLRMIVN